MSQILYPVFEKVIDYSLKTTGEFIAAYIEELEELAERLQTKSLSEFSSFSDEEVAALLESGDLDPDEVSNIPQGEWFSAEQGVQTLALLLTQLSQESSTEDNFMSGVINELQDLKKALEEASQEGIRFHLRMS